MSTRLPWLILIFGVLASSLAAWNIRTQIENEAHAAFQIQALDFQTSIASRLRSYEDVLFGIAGLYHSGPNVTPQEFAAYAESLDLKTRFRAIEFLNYAKYFVASEREQFAASFKTGAGGVTDGIASPILPAGGNEYMVITHTYPAGAPGLGFNLMTTSGRLSQAAFPPLSASLYRPNVPLSSGIPLRLPDRTSASLAVRLGIFSADRARHARLTGTAGIGFNVEEFFRETLPPTLANQISYRVKNIGRSDGTKHVRPVAIFESLLADQPSSTFRFGPAKFLTTSFTLPFGGALLQVEMSEAKSNLVGERDQVLPFIVLVGGLLFFGMAATLSRKMLELNRALIRAITLQTSDLARQMDRAKQLEQALTHVAEDERQRIGHELHDDLGQRLTGLSLSFKALSETLQSVSSDLSARAEALERHASEAIASVRGLAHGLMPVPAGCGGLREALAQLAASVSSLHMMHCLFDFDDPVDVDNAHVAANLYRIAQEAVNNAIRHSHATVVKIRLDDDDGKVTLTISDNGVGFQHDGDADTHAVQVAGAGLRIMAHRASVIHFRLTVDSSIGGGTSIKAQQCWAAHERLQ